MKKIICFTVAIILISLSSFATAKSKNNWYFSSKSQNDRPGLPSVSNQSVKGIGKEEKVLYLTFDAGYENGNVEKIVNILQENDVRAAFFVLKHFVAANPDLCRKIKDNGNLICNHTSSHASIANLSKEELKNEILGLESFLKDSTGIEMDRYFRPPEGWYSEEALKVVEELGYKTVFWSLAWADWDNNNQKNYDYAMDKLLTRVHDGAVILLHPTSETNCKILGDFIKAMKQKGYRFATPEELWDA